MCVLRQYPLHHTRILFCQRRCDNFNPLANSTPPNELTILAVLFCRLHHDRAAAQLGAMQGLDGCVGCLNRRQLDEGWG